MPAIGSILAADNPFVLAWKMMHLAHEMSTALNGNGHGTNGLLRQIKRKVEKPQAAGPASGTNENRVNFTTADGVKLQGVLVRVTRHTAVFELYSPGAAPRLSEALIEFEISMQARVVYAGRAVVRNVLDAGTKTVCETTLQESDWTDWILEMASRSDGDIAAQFKNFLTDWQKLYRISPEFKVVIADMQTFLHDLWQWLGRLELDAGVLSAEGRQQKEMELAQQLGVKVAPAIQNFFDRFEDASNRVDEDQVAFHHVFGKRLIHPFLLASPFVQRTFSKPLGYAGDYEMVNMMFRNPFEGESLFGKMINLYALQLPPIVAHRNRINYLDQKIKAETLRVKAHGRPARVFSMGCGPAQEVQKFLTDDKLANHADFTLADFNDETLERTSRKLEELKRHYVRRATIRPVKKNVYQMIKESARAGEHSRYDLIYCAGLFDYLSDQVCRQVVDVLYTMLLPGGLLIVTNVDDHPAQNQMECFLEWHLVHRNEAKMRTIVPKIPDLDVSMKRDPTGVNIFVEVRKPDCEK